MKIVADKAVPFLQGVFEPYAEVVYKPGIEIGPDDVKDADAMIIRTRTKCNAALLENSSVKIIATATIGTDHIDLEYCKSKGIFVANAAGCNAGGVMDYVFSAIYGCAARKCVDLSNATLGIIGVGHVGSRVEQMARQLGFKVLLCDPPRALAEGPGQFVDQDTLLAESDIVTMHVPLLDTTIGMANSDFFSKMKVGAFFINASRGEVVVDNALLEAMPKLGPVIIDTWNGEPNINLELLEKVDIATPHIAGYSYQGKQNGTASSVRAIARFFDVKPLFDFFPLTPLKELEACKLDVNGKTQGEIASLFQYNYPIFTDDFMFRSRHEEFEKLRNEYNYRREFYLA